LDKKKESANGKSEIRILKQERLVNGSVAIKTGHRVSDDGKTVTDNNWLEVSKKIKDTGDPKQDWVNVRLVSADVLIVEQFIDIYKTEFGLNGAKL